MHKKIFLWAAICGFFAVIIGAFVSHYLKPKLTPENYAVFQTGVQYHFYHTMALFSVGTMYKRYRHNLIKTAAFCFGFGIIFFSGSLYLLKLSSLATDGEEKWLAYFTPFGGFLFIAGWLCIILYFIKDRDTRGSRIASNNPDSSE